MATLIRPQTSDDDREDDKDTVMSGRLVYNRTVALFFQGYALRNFIVSVKNSKLCIFRDYHGRS